MEDFFSSWCQNHIGAISTVSCRFKPQCHRHRHQLWDQQQHKNQTLFYWGLFVSIKSCVWELLLSVFVQSFSLWEPGDKKTRRTTTCFFYVIPLHRSVQTLRLYRNNPFGRLFFFFFVSRTFLQKLSHLCKKIQKKKKYSGSSYQPVNLLHYKYTKMLM